MAIDAQSLQQLLETPSERPDLELKGWLDLADNGHKGMLAIVVPTKDGHLIKDLL